MNHRDHVNLLRGGVAGTGGLWADFGSGRGAFTLALAELIGPAGVIYSVDSDLAALREQQRLMRQQFPDLTVHYLNASFTQPLDLPALDGIVMANSLHFIRDKAPVLALALRYLRPGGRLVLVEYQADQGNTWVPYPFSFASWEEMARQNGFVGTRLLSTRSGSFLDGMYSALGINP